MNENREQQPRTDQHRMEHHRLSQTMAGLHYLKIARLHMPEPKAPAAHDAIGVYYSSGSRSTQTVLKATDNLSQIRRAIEGMDIKDVTIEPDKQDLPV